MDYLFVCNTASDYLSRINLDLLNEEKITLSCKEGRMGPHGICCFKSDLIIANSYNNSISKVSMFNRDESETHYIGTHCNDVDVYEEELYVTCGESNNIIVFDLKSNKIVEELPSGNLPHSIIINKKNGLAVVTNMESDSITLVDCKNHEINYEIQVGPYPTKALFSEDGNYIYVCESNIGSDEIGSVSLVSLKTKKIECRIYAGKAPVDMCYENDFCFVSNFIEGTISIIHLRDKEEVKKISIGGMPRGIVKKGRYVYVGDNYSNLLVKYDLLKDSKKILPIGGEPTGMVLV
jgi:Cytochrome D1 heme domain.